MNGYEMMADSYRTLVKQGKIDKETADKEIRIKALEARVSLLERFISLPQVKPLWEQFQALIGRKKPQKDHDGR